MIGVLWIICHVTHGTQRINFLTLRPWRIVLMSLFFTSLKASMTEAFIDWSVYFIIERFCKFCNIIFGLTLIFEKQILSLFMVYQAHFELNQHDVMKDELRKVESKINKRYWFKITAIFAYIVCTEIVSASLESEKTSFLITKAIFNLSLMSI